VNPY